MAPMTIEDAVAAIDRFTDAELSSTSLLVFRNWDFGEVDEPHVLQQIVDHLLARARRWAPAGEDAAMFVPLVIHAHGDEAIETVDLVREDAAQLVATLMDRHGLWDDVNLANRRIDL